MSVDMTIRERTELAQLVRRREKVAKSGAKQRAAELLADVEAQLATVYEQDDERWRDITAAAKEAVAQADAEIARVCEAHGIPAEFRPGVALSWFGRGQNALASPQAELRKVATTRIAALEAAAKVDIERRSVEVQTELLAAGLTTGYAQSFLSRMPTIEALMPTMPLAELEAAVPIGRGREWS